MKWHWARFGLATPFVFNLVGWLLCESESHSQFLRAASGVTGFVIVDVLWLFVSRLSLQKDGRANSRLQWRVCTCAEALF